MSDTQLLPSGWTPETVLSSAAVIMDYRGRTPTKLGMTWGGGPIPALSARNVRMGRIDFREACNFGSELLHRKWMTKGDTREGDVLITTEAPLGNVALIPDSRKYILSQRTVLLRPNSALFDVTYFAQFLRSPIFQRALRENATGSTALGIQRRRLERLEVHRPPLAEQREIGAALQDADDLIAVLERLITQKRDIKQGIAQALLTGRVRLPGFRASWDVVRFDRTAVQVKERALPADIDPTSTLVELEHIESGSGRLIASATAATAVSHKTVFQPGDVLFGRLRSYLRKYWIAARPGLCSTEIWVLRPTHLATGTFLRYLVETEWFVAAATGGYGTHMPRADWNVVRGLEVALPPRDEQEAIAKVLADADAEIDLLRQRLEKAEAIKEGMAQQLLTGRVRLPELEPVA